VATTVGIRGSAGGVGARYAPTHPRGMVKTAAATASLRWPYEGCESRTRRGSLFTGRLLPGAYSVEAYLALLVQSQIRS
jgi:hypothetical protein